ncbi:hypothetical protein QE419_002548 [Brevundimonas vesicularis]|nr:hypothetical protein [Brevundimonas vesicularis]
MSFAARAFRDEARRYRELTRSINCPRTLSLLNEMAGDLKRKAEAMEDAATCRSLLTSPTDTDK